MDAIKSIRCIFVGVCLFIEIGESTDRQEPDMFVSRHLQIIEINRIERNEPEQQKQILGEHQKRKTVK